MLMVRSLRSSRRSRRWHPSVESEAYEKDHRAPWTPKAFALLKTPCPPKRMLETARATAVPGHFLDGHLMKEDTHLYRIIRERVSVPDQGQAGGGRRPSTVPCWIASPSWWRGVDVPAARHRRPREHDPHLADGDAC